MTDEEFIEICNNADSMAAASSIMGIHFNTLKRKALLLGCYNTNQGSKGCKKEWISDRSIPVNEILEGLHPQYQTYKLKQKLYKAGIKQNKCEICNIDKWNGKEIECELDHKNGNSKDHRLENLRIICPNCHSQTNTFRAKNIKGRVT